MNRAYVIKNDSYLAHYGVQGMKWGVRNYQNPDGTLTAAGRSRYSIGNAGKVHNSDKIYQFKNDGTNGIGFFKRGSIASGQVASNEKYRIGRLMKQDIKSEMKSGKMSKEEGTRRLKNVKTDVDHIVRKQLGNSSVNAIGKYKAAATAACVSSVLVTLGGVAAYVALERM